MTSEAVTALIAAGAAIVGAAVPTVTSFLDARSKRDQSSQEREFERDRSWERYQTGLRACYRKLLDSFEEVKLASGLIPVKDARRLRSNYYESYFAADDEIKGHLDLFWPVDSRDERLPPNPELRQPLLDAMRAQTKRTRQEQEALDRKAAKELEELDGDPGSK
jgi:hypothetical protein